MYSRWLCSIMVYTDRIKYEIRLFRSICMYIHSLYAVALYELGKTLLFRLKLSRDRANNSERCRESTGIDQLTIRQYVFVSNLSNQFFIV